MDPYSLAPVSAILHAAYGAVMWFAELIAPWFGSMSAALAIVTLTLLVRCALIPVGISQVKAEWTRRRLAPKLKALQLKYKKNPQKLNEMTMKLYKDEHASPLAGMLPALAQAPVLSIVYGLFIRPVIGGEPNALLSAELFGSPLGAHLVSSGWPVFVVLLAVIAVVSWISRRIAVRLTLPGDSTTLTRALSWLPFITVVFAAIVPLAATLYLSVTVSWTLVERIVLRRIHWKDQPVSGTQ